MWLLKKLLLLLLIGSIGESCRNPPKAEFKVAADRIVAEQDFGCSVGVHSWSSIIGACWDPEKGREAGAAYLFEHRNGKWSQEAKITAREGREGDGFGCSVAIYGDFAIAGAWRQDGKGSDSGAAYIFHRSNGSWQQYSKLLASDGAANQNFGHAVSIFGDYAIVGADNDNVNGVASGSAYIFRHTGHLWKEEAKLIPKDGAEYDGFGLAVSIFNDLAVVGSPFDDDVPLNSGSVYIFERSGQGWIQSGKIVASDAAMLDEFGRAVSVWGSHIIVGVENDTPHSFGSSVYGPGAAYVFRHQGNSWIQDAKLTPPDSVSSPDRLGERFGVSVSLFGNMAVVGADNDDDKGVGSGSVYIFSRIANGWRFSKKILASDGREDAWFGRAVASTKDFIVVGTSGPASRGHMNKPQTVYIYPKLAWQQR